MSDRPWWAVILQWSLWGVVMALVMAWISRSRFRRRHAEDGRRLVHPISTLIIGLVGVGFFGGITVMSNMFPNETVTWWTTAIFVAFALLSTPFVTLYFTDDHRVSEEGLSYTTFLGARRHIAWSDVVAVRFTSLMNWFRVQAGSGRVARLSVLLMGLPEFARLALTLAPSGAIDTSTREILHATADGRPPSVWGV